MGARKDWSKIADVVTKCEELDIPFTEGAKRFGVKLRDIYEHNHRFKNGKDKEPKAESEETEVEEDIARDRPSKLPEELKELIVTYRLENPTHGFKRISDLMKQKYLVVVTRKAIRKFLKEAGLLETCDSSFDKEESAKGTRRFEAAGPGDLWQMDVTYVYIQKEPVLYLVVIVDDWSESRLGRRYHHRPGLSREDPRVGCRGLCGDRKNNLYAPWRRDSGGLQFLSTWPLPLLGRLWS